MYELQVDGMTCGGCANSVKRAVQSVDGNARVDVDLAGKTVRVESGVPIGEVEAAIVGAGFPVTGKTAA